MDVVRTPDARFEGLPGWPYEPRYVEISGLRLARVDEGSGEPVVLVHGEPTWSFLYRNVFPPLLDAGLRVIAPDHAGFGRSDKPADVGWYSYERHYDLLSRHLAALSLDRVTLVVHDWGGPLGLRWAMEHQDRVARIVILNTGLFSGRESSAGLDAWIAYARAQTDLDVGALLDRACGGLPPEVVAGYDAPFPSVASKAGALAFPRIIPASLSDPGAAEQLAAREALDAWEGPVTVAFSDADPIFPVRVGESWARRLRNAKPFVRIEGAAHFVPEMRPDAVAAAILDAF
jgi:haloalkane dehalogenase